jgi:hypothetical protein
MKTRTFVLLISVLLILSCEKDKYESTGTITGFDSRLCYYPCCGGYLIQIEGKQYHFEKEELPENFSFNEKELPIEVTLNWKLVNVVCGETKWIKITKIRRSR